MSIKAFLEVTLVSLPLDCALFYKIYEKTQIILLQSFAAQPNILQTNIFRRQKFELFFQ